MSNRLLIAIPLSGILGGLGLLHAYLALGGRWGTAYIVPTINGRRSFDPSPLATWIVCLGHLVLIAALLVARTAGGRVGPVAAEALAEEKGGKQRLSANRSPRA